MNENRIGNVLPEKNDTTEDEKKKWLNAIENMQRIIKRSERKLVYFQNRVKQALFMERPNQRKVRAANAQIGWHAAHLEELQSELRELEYRYNGGIQLRQTEKNDIRRIWNLINRPGIREILYPGRVTFDTFQADSQNWITNPQFHILSILIQRTKTFIGFLILQSKADNVAVKLIVIQPDYRGRSYGADALDEAVHLAFEELGAVYVTGHVPPENHAALRCFEKARFHYIGYTDALKSHYTMEIYKDDWETGATSEQGTAPERLTVPLSELMRTGL